jgi:hypothetical protein
MPPLGGVLVPVGVGVGVGLPFGDHVTSVLEEQFPAAEPEDELPVLLHGVWLGESDAVTCETPAVVLCSVT